LAVPFKGNIDQDQSSYNNRHYTQRMRVECTIGRLKGRFKRFTSRIKNGESSSSVGLFYFACLVYNIIELHKLDNAEDFYQEYILMINPEHEFF
jgi:hypothetical protein